MFFQQGFSLTSSSFVFYWLFNFHNALTRSPFLDCLANKLLTVSNLLPNSSEDLHLESEKCLFCSKWKEHLGNASLCWKKMITHICGTFIITVKPLDIFQQKWRRGGWKNWDFSKSLCPSNPCNGKNGIYSKVVHLCQL